MARSLQEVEKDIQANRKALYRACNGRFDVMDAAAWQWAWDRHPDMQARDAALVEEYVEAMHERDARKFAKAKAARQRRSNAAAQLRRIGLRAVANYQCAVAA